MNELVSQLMNYAYGAWRYRWYGVAVAWAVCLAGWTWLYFQPNIYRATAQVYVDTDTILRPLLAGMVVRPNIQNKVALVTRILLSRPNLEKVVRSTDLDLRAGTPEKMEQLLLGLDRRIDIRGTRRDNFYTISYVDPNPVMAKRIVQNLLNSLVENTLGAGRTDSNTAQRFLNQQIKTYEEKLNAADDRLRDFKQKHVGTMPQQGRGYYDRLQGAMAELQNAKLQLAEAERTQDILSKELGGDEPTFGIMSEAGGSGGPLDARINALQSRLDNLLLRYTNRHPDVIAVKAQLKELEAQRKKELARLAASGAVGGVAENPVYQKLKISLSETQARTAGLRVKARAYQKRVDYLKKMVNTIPAVEAQLARLNRNYSVTRSQYDNLIKRREQAKMTQQVEQSSDDIKFKIIDPPFVAPKPVAPKRLVLELIILLGGLGVGLGFAFFLSQLKSTFNDRRVLRRVTGFPVLGTVGTVFLGGELARRRIEAAMLVITVLLLIGAYIGGAALTILKVGA
jgi:polysaccharide chain length determinant protein (PEP-CTERM system associated)